MLDEQPVTTGRFLITVDDSDQDPIATMETLRHVSGMRVASSADYVEEVATEAFPKEADALYLNELGVAVVESTEDRIVALQTAAVAQSRVLSIEPEILMYALPERRSDDYIRGFRDGVASLARSTLAEEVEEEEEAIRVRAAFADDEFSTWGLKATGVVNSKFSGCGIKVAILDTGIDPQHPDFAGRNIVSRSFVPSETVQDVNGHGTHCAGTACGPLASDQRPRYGAAPNALLHVGKVLSDRGSGPTGGIIEGMRWAVREGCHIISMSLGSATRIGQPVSRAFERAAQRALAAGSLVIAAAGNESFRPFKIAPIGSPGNCPSVLTVAALDPGLRVASFSCGRTDPDTGDLEIAGPGVSVFSSFPIASGSFKKLNGTSMATPHVAGIGALHAESDASLRAERLWRRLEQSAKRLPLPARDVGRGLVQAP